jgi:hypothetical protein
MPGLVPGIHANTALIRTTWMAGTGPAMTMAGRVDATSVGELALPP